MKVIAAVQADLDVTTLGMRSRLADELCGTTVLRRTVASACRIKAVESVYVLAREDQVARCRELLAGLSVRVLGMTCEPPAWLKIVQASRKWSLDGWRGGVGGSTVFDEYIDCRLLCGLLKCDPADAVICVPPSGVLFDAELADKMIQHRRHHPAETRMTFTQAVPGIAGIVLDVGLIQEMAAAAIPLSWLFTYKPDEPRKDLIFQKACMDIPAPLRFATGRLMADTDHSWGTLTKMFGQRDLWTGEQIGAYLVQQDERGTEDFPREVEVELTTDDPYPNSLLAPRGDRLGRKGRISLGLLEKLSLELAERNDSLCVLGGFGDPLLHPELSRALEVLRPRTSGSKTGVFGLCVRTAGAALTHGVIRELIHHDVDILSVSLDAWSPETHLRIKGPSSMDDRGLLGILSNLDSLSSAQRDAKFPTPIMVPDFIKARENAAEMDDFFDGWTRRAGAVSISGFSNYAGQIEDRAVIDMRPPSRIPCRRLRNRCLILADGRVVLCDQDFKGNHPIGDLHNATLQEIWKSQSFEKTRRDHLAASYECNSLCAGCAEWHRP